MLRIKLVRTGKKNDAKYRIVVSEARSKNTGGQVVENLGHYDPHHPDNRLVINSDQYQVWIGKGAQPTDTVRQLVAKSK